MRFFFRRFIDRSEIAIDGEFSEILLSLEKLNINWVIDIHRFAKIDRHGGDWDPSRLDFPDNDVFSHAIGGQMERA